MTATRIGLIGPSRRRNGTGPFVARHLADAGATVAAVCGSTPGSGAVAARDLGRQLGYEPRAFGDVDAMLAAGGLDAVAICTPAPSHERFLEVALEAGLHVFCEKPLIWSGDGPSPDRCAALLRAFDARGIVVHENTQWPYLLDDMRTLTGRALDGEVTAFEMRLAPPEGGAAMFSEAASHPVSVLVALGASGHAERVSVRLDGEDRMTVAFRAHRGDGPPIDCRVVLAVVAAQPRPCTLWFDGCPVDRVVASMSPYRLCLQSGTRLVSIEDPVSRSVGAFMRRVRGVDAAAPGAELVRARLLGAIWPEVRRSLERRSAAG